MNAPLRLAIAGVILLLSPHVRAQNHIAMTSSVVAEPVMDRSVANVDASATKGIAWRWTDEGQRNIGQCFQVVETLEARELAIQVCSAMAKARAGAPFRLRFFHSAEGISLGAQVAEGAGKLPGSDEKLKSGTWLLLKFDPVKLDAGRYAFLLEFTEGPAEGQGVVFVIGNTPSVKNPSLISTPGDAGAYQAGAPVNFILSGGKGHANAGPVSERELLVDRRGGAPFRTIAAAVEQARPGDTIRLASGSGPYREMLYIRHSGQEGKPIIFDGGGETVTGFEPLTGFRQEGGKWICDLKPILSNLKGVQGFANQDGIWRNDAFPKAVPTVLTYRGERLTQGAKDGQFTRYARLSDDGGTLILDEGVSPEGWEIAVRPHVVRVLNVSHHIYRNLRASGSLNDGFNLHGAGADLVFENVEAFHNLDEGFSGHDQIHCRIEKGDFWGNDNGLYGSQEELVASDVEIHDNLGYGFGSSGGRAALSHSKVWANGMCQIVQSAGTIVYEDVTVYDQMRPERPWLTVQESRKQEKPEVSRVSDQANVPANFSTLAGLGPAKP